MEGGEALGGGSLMRMGVMRRDQAVGLVVGVAVEGEGSVAAVKMVMMMNLERKNQVRTISPVTCFYGYRNVFFMLVLNVFMFLIECVKFDYQLYKVNVYVAHRMC